MSRHLEWLMRLIGPTAGSGGGGYPEPTGSITIDKDGTFDVKDAATAVVTADALSDLMVFDPWSGSGRTEYSNNGISGVPDYGFYNWAMCRDVMFSNVMNVGKYGFYGCSELVNLTLSTMQTVGVGEHAFDRCYNLQSLSAMPMLSGSGGTAAFKDCYALKHLELRTQSTGATEVFSGCRALEWVKLWGIGSASIGSKWFNGCSALAALVIQTTTRVIPLSATDAFTGTPIASGTGFIYVPDALVDSYKTATNWSTYADQIKPLSEYVEPAE